MLKQGNQPEGAPAVEITIRNFHGAGQYDFRDAEVIVNAGQGSDKSYWKNLGSYAGRGQSFGTIKVKRCDDRFVAEISGTLNHIGHDQQRPPEQTNFIAATDQFIERQDRPNLTAFVPILQLLIKILK
ncbi:hypothetical protein [Pedobacter sp. SYP-B3415]|uniref:hypothetical protein n=1 Tax=Pedobacter sp. SYP-B3415 TaxID=2496641 RepID=UPI00101B893A|nr:hypothetical protein [Pedobacter sp. SYP-B3415]